MAKTNKRKIGDLGEDLACKYLLNKGFLVLGRNYLQPWGEIDIIAEKSNVLRFIEVKSVSTSPSDAHDAGRESKRDVSRVPIRPEENFHPTKLRRLHRAIQTYLMDHKVSEDINWQIDLACVYIDFTSKKGRIRFLENIIL